MKTKKLIAVIIAIIMLVGVFTACKNVDDPEQPSGIVDDTEEATTEEQTPEIVRVAVLKGPTGMQMSYLMHEVNSGTTTYKNNYSFVVESAPDVVNSAILSGEVDIAAIPSNAAAALFYKTNGKIKIIATNTLNVLQLLTNDATITSFADLEGKTIIASGEGTTAQYVLEKILTENGLVIGETVNIEYIAEHSESVTRAMNGTADIVVLPEPFATQLLSADIGYNIGIDLNLAIDAARLNIIMGVYVVRTEFLEKYPTAVENFLEDGLGSHTFLTSSVDVVATYIEESDIMPAAVAAKAIPNIRFRFETGEKMKELCDGMFDMLFVINPQSIGGALPTADIYYTN